MVIRLFFDVVIRLFFDVVIRLFFDVVIRLFFEVVLNVFAIKRICFETKCFEVIFEAWGYFLSERNFC